MNYLIAVLPDRIQAEAAYCSGKRRLAHEASQHFGRGYKTADEFGLIDPNQQANKQAKLMAVWLVPFGFIAGVTFSLMTQLKTFAWAGEIGDHAIGGVLGAIAAGWAALLLAAPGAWLLAAAMLCPTATV